MLSRDIDMRLDLIPRPCRPMMRFLCVLMLVNNLNLLDSGVNTKHSISPEAYPMDRIEDLLSKLALVGYLRPRAYSILEFDH